MSAELSLPDPSEMESARFIGRELSQLETAEKRQKIEIVFRKGTEEKVVAFPPAAFHLLIEIMEQMALGNSVTLIPVHAQLTTQEAANLLNVSRPFVVKLLEEGKIPYTKVGSHRRIEFRDLIKFKKKILAESERAREELARIGQEMQRDE